MSTPTIVRKSSNAPNNDQGTTQPTQPVRPTRIIRVLSTKKLGGEAGTTDSNESTLSTNNVTSTNAESTTTTSVLDNDAGANNNTDNSSSSSSPQSNVTKKVVRRVIVKKPTTDLTATTTSPNINNTVSPSTSPPLTQEILTSSDNSTSSTPNNNSTSSTTTPVVTPVIVSNVATTTPPTVTPRTGGVAARWLAMQQNGGNTTSGASSNINTNSNNEKIPATINNTNNTNNSTNTDDDNNNTPTTTTTTNEPTTPKRIVRPSRPGSQKYESNVASTPSSDSHSTNTSTTTTSTTSTTTTNGDSTSENANSSYADLGSKLKRVGAKVSLPPSVPPSNGTSPHQASKSMTPDIPSNNNSVNGTTESTSAKSRIKDMRSKLETIALLTPEQMLEKKKQEKAGFEKIRPLFQSEISEWYGNSSVTSEDPKYDSSSLEDLKRQAPDINFTSFIYNPLFDEQLACDTPEIQMSSQEILQYNFVIELMKKKYPNLLTLDPITFDEEMRNASNRSSLSFKHSSGRTDSVTTTEDVLSREDIGYPIQKCSKNWKYQLKKKKENSAKVNNNYTEAIFTPRASVQLQSSSPSSPATASNSSVNPLFDHLYYMPCWKHQLQLDQLSMKSHEQKTIQ